MEPVTASLVAAGIGSGMDLLGGMMGNSASASEARKARNWSWTMMRDQYELQRRGLVQAGYNPMLAVMQGASPHVPQGPVARQENPMRSAGQIVSSAVQNAATVENIEANTAKNLADANLARQQARESEARVPTYGATVGLTQSQTEKVRAEVGQVLSNTALSSVQYNKVLSEIDQLAKQGDLTMANTNEALARANLTTAQIAEVQPRIEKLIQDAAYTKANIGKAELLGLPGNILKGLTSSAKADSTLGERIADFLTSGAKSIGDSMYEHGRRRDPKHFNRR